MVAWANDCDYGTTYYTTSSGCSTGDVIYYNTWGDGTTAGSVTTTTNTYTYTLGGNGYYQPVLWHPDADGVWHVWGGGGGAVIEAAPMPVLTPEQIAEQQRQLELRRIAAEEEQRVWREQEAARQAARLGREQKAEGLIKEILGELQYTAFKKRGYIDIPSGFDPTKRYRIRPHKMIGVVKLVNGEWQEQHQALCIHPAESYVEGDVVATKIALCKFEERTLLEKANVHQMRAA